MAERRGPRIKPTIETSGDIAYGGVQREKLRASLLRRLEEWEQQQQLLEDVHDRAWALVWIRDHGGSVTAALKQTHPDTGGSSEDFQLTQEAREILRRRQRPT